jgi:hypothetical protein
LAPSSEGSKLQALKKAFGMCGTGEQTEIVDTPCNVLRDNKFKEEIRHIVPEIGLPI